MSTVSALLVHPDRRVRTELGRLTRAARHAVFLAADGEEALRLVARHRGLRVIAVAPSAGGPELLERLMERRPGATGLLLEERELEEPARAGLDRRLAEAVVSLGFERQLRLQALLSRRLRARLARSAERLAAERLARLAGRTSAPRLAAGGVSA